MKESRYQTAQFNWSYQGISLKLQIKLAPNWIGTNHDHLEVRTIHPECHPLPITSTGYRSIWLPHGHFASVSKAVDATKEWLDLEAAKPAWVELIRNRNQLSLF